MWYFSWILGVLLACSLGIINVLWLEAQEALAKENEDLDPLTHVLSRKSMTIRLREKVENSKRNGSPFSLLFVSLTKFRVKQVLLEHELDAILLRVVAVIKQNVRSGVDLVAKIDQEDFVLALPGASLERAEQLSAHLAQEVASKVMTPSGEPVFIAIGSAEFSAPKMPGEHKVAVSVDEVDLLLSKAQKAAAGHV